MCTNVHVHVIFIYMYTVQYKSEGLSAFSHTLYFVIVFSCTCTGVCHFKTVVNCALLF